jgi:cytochrome c-type biogenesis protein CcsB
VNILNMVFSGHLFRLVPLENDPAQTWVAVAHRGAPAQSEVAESFFPAYRDALLHGIQEGHYDEANELLVGLDGYQHSVGAAVLPSETQQKAEIFLNESRVFNRLAPYYALLGVVFLMLLLVQVFKPDFRGMSLVFRSLFLLLVLGFIAHTGALGLRWYVSERAPWSNGYESMIYIAWTTTLAGLLFTRKSAGGLAATNVLSGIILLIAMLSYLNPEITPLVPVLKSYWLTIHVSLEAGSYGFLMLGAVIGMINLILMALTSKESEKRVKLLIRELSYISEMTLIGGLFMLSVGTYLGGVWANESWGRYWGWDAKETWALVSILVYAVILHLRFVPKVNGLFAFNFASLFGLASIIMTYFGVNYYLSGLHSYAAGDPVPIPSWVYYSVAGLMVLSFLAARKNRRFRF